MTAATPSSIKRPPGMNLYTCVQCDMQPPAKEMALHCGHCNWWKCPRCKWVNGPQGAIRGGGS